MPDLETLTEREAAVLAAVVEIGLKKGEPVGAQALAREKEFALCPASIRNIMAKLEREGYLCQPHASAGREPTDEGYGYYARRLATAPKLSRESVRMINEAVEDPALPETAARLDALSHAISRLSRQVGLAGFLSSEAAPIREYSFMSLGSKTVGAVMATMSGELLRYAVKPGWDSSAKKLEKMASYFNGKFSYMTVPQARRLLFRESGGAMGEHAPLAKDAYRLALALEQGMAARDSQSVYVEGVGNLMSHVEGNEDMETIKSMVATLGEKKKLMLLLDQLSKSEGKMVVIGSQSQIDGFSGCSVVAHSFAGSHGVEGIIGVIGKKRMDYGLALALVSMAARRLTASLRGGMQWG